MKEDSNEYMYKDGMMSNDIFSFANASGNVIAGEDRTHWATMGAYLKLNWNYDNIYFFEFSGVMMALHVLQKETVGDFSLHSLLVMILPEQITSRG